MKGLRARKILACVLLMVAASAYAESPVDQAADPASTSPAHSITIPLAEGSLVVSLAKGVNEAGEAIDPARTFSEDGEPIFVVVYAIRALGIGFVIVEDAGATRIFSIN